MRFLGATIAATACTCILLTGCSELRDLGLSHKQVDYASWADAPKHGSVASVPPSFVPHDASDLYIRTLLDGSGATITFKSTEQLSPALCAPGPLTGKPRLDSNWWPDANPPADGMICDGWRVFESHGATYGWIDGRNKEN